MTRAAGGPTGQLLAAIEGVTKSRDAVEFAARQALARPDDAVAQRTLLDAMNAADTRMADLRKVRRLPARIFAR